MRNRLLISCVAIAVASTSIVFAADKEKTVSGVVIDQACASRYMQKDDPQAAAASHPISCALKDSCAASGYELITGKEETKFDVGSTAKVKEYLQKDGATTKVTVVGTQNPDGTLSVSTINPQN